MSLRRWPLYERVLVSLVSGDAISGLLVATRGPLLVLTRARLLSETAEPTDLDGQVYVERTKVLFLQSVPSEQG